MFNIDNMTVFDLKVLNEYVSLNDILFNCMREELDRLYSACSKAIREKANSDPGIIDVVKKNYIQQSAVIVGENLKNVPVEVTNEIIKYLNRYYNTVFVALGMANAQNGQLSAFDICNNYYICSSAAEELEMILQQRKILGDRR